jgi:hypothetical protein
MPVPANRDDEAYFAPLRDLGTPADTELYLGLVHESDGVEGTRRRIAAAARVKKHFGIATECGMGRVRNKALARKLFRIHAEAAAD